jgi:hypothetical protein
MVKAEDYIYKLMATKSKTCKKSNLKIKCRKVKPCQKKLFFVLIIRASKVEEETSKNN